MTSMISSTKNELEVLPEMLSMFDKDIDRLKRKIERSNDPKIAFYGSSSIRLWVSIEKDLDPFSVINLGFGGSTFQWMNYYFEALFQDLSPKHIFLYAGDNDMSNGFSPQGILKEFQILKNKIKHRYPSSTIHGITIKPSPLRAHLLGKIAETNSNLSALLNGKLVNIFDQMLDSNGNTQPELFLQDGLHMNKKGYAIWAKEVKEYMIKRIEH